MLIQPLQVANFAKNIPSSAWEAMSFIFLCIVVALFNLSNCASIENKKIGNEEDRKWTKGGKCRFKWRPERLNAECPGLQLHSTFEEIKHIQVVNNSVICKSLCCNLEDKCTTWQYEIGEKTCMLGGAVVTANETAPVGMTILGKCKVPVATWSGRRIEARKNGTCTWGKRLPNQCTGLGAERKHKNGTRLSSRQCEMACCESKECDVWQESPKHGCYFGLKDVVKCDENFKRKVYDGGRKCIPGLCGGMENVILNRTIPTASVLRAKANENSKSLLLNDKQSNTLVGSAMSAFKSTFGNVGALAEIDKAKSSALSRSRVPPAAAAGSGAATTGAGSAGAEGQHPVFGSHKGGNAAVEGQRQFDMNKGGAKPRPMKGRPKFAPGSA